MTTPARIAGIPGKRPPKHAPALKLSRLLTGTIPDHPASEDYLAALGGGWQVLGNDRAGNCCAVTWSNIRRLVTTTLTDKGYYPAQSQVWDIYRTQNPDFDPDGDPAVNGPGSVADRGMNIQELLEYLVQTGGPDGVKAVAFAAVDHANPDEVKAAVAIFGFVWTGVLVSQRNQQEWAAGQPWDWDASSPVDGGHSIITGGYGTPGAGPLGGDERFITWGAETSFTDAFWSNSVDESWVVIWPEHLASREFLQGIDLAALAADYEAITGRILPVTPQPAPKGKHMFAAIEAKLAAIWHELDGEAKAEWERLLADAKAQEAKFAPLLTEFRTDLKAAIATLEPEAKAAIEALLSRLLTSAGGLLGTDLTAE